MRHTKQAETHLSHVSVERRNITRTTVSFGLMYSGITAKDEVLLGDGMAVDLSEGGLGIRGNYPVKVGMELTLFLYSPDAEDPMFVLEGTVAWTKRALFGVALKEYSLHDGTRLRSFLRAHSVAQA